MTYRLLILTRMVASLRSHDHNSQLRTNSYAAGTYYIVRQYVEDLYF